MATSRTTALPGAAPPALRGIDARALVDSHDTLKAEHDALVVVGTVPLAAHLGALGPAGAAVEAAVAIDAGLGRGARPPVVLPSAAAPGGRLVLGPMSALRDDTDDVRLVAEATAAAVARAVDSGARRPLVAVFAADAARFARATDIAALAALGSQWAPLEAREAEKAPPAAEHITIAGLAAERAAHVTALETGRRLARDITGTEPERMAPRRIAALCKESFAGTGVEVTVEEDVGKWPLLAAVARASQVVERHRPCVVRLEYAPKGPVKRTIFLAGKGVTYDTGGADVKTDGGMAGMSRDKGGAGSVAGFVRAAAALQLPGVRIVGLLGLVRNSIGEEAFVSDEIIKSRAGVRVRVGNTDAEGRLVLADLLAECKELAAGQPDPFLFSIATLTGHVHRAYGPYVGAVANGPARARGDVDTLDRLGEEWGEPLHQSRPRREDYTMVAPKGVTEDVISANRLASVNTSRGHQLPFAFMDIAAGLRGGPLPWVHLDIAGAALDPPDWQAGRPTGTPVLTLAAWAAS